METVVTKILDSEASEINGYDKFNKATPLAEIKEKQISPIAGSIFNMFAEVNKELWIILSMLLIILVMNYLLSGHRMLLGLYTIPTLISAFAYGRRHATLTAFASVFVVGLYTYLKPSLFKEASLGDMVIDGRWYEFIAWGGILIITAYAMGTLYERNATQLRELKSTYQGLIVILRHFISKDQYTENHCYSVSIYAAKIASYMNFNPEQIEDIRSAALLHDLGKLEISRNLLHKAARLSEEEYKNMKRHVEKGVEILKPLDGPLARIIPIILSHHEHYDGSGYYASKGEQIPLEGRVLAVADVYDSLVSDRPYRKAMSPYEVKEIIEKGAGTDFDPYVVKAFIKAFNRMELEVPNVVV
jgi:putative nucleotidyltransferase with HDIG domain